MHETRTDLQIHNKAEKFLDGYYVGIVQCDAHKGWYAPVQRLETDHTQWSRVLIYLFVKDESESSSYSGWLPFLVDTGAARTIIPRSVLVNADGRQVENAFRWGLGNFHVMRGVQGERVAGFECHASLLLRAPNLSEEAIQFRIKPIIVQLCNLHYGILGMDALEYIHLRLDSAYCSFCSLLK